MLYYCFFFYHLIQICPNHEAESLSGDRVSHGIQLAWSQTGQFLVGAGDANTVRLSTVVLRSGWGTCPHSQTAVSQPWIWTRRS